MDKLTRVLAIGALIRVAIPLVLPQTPLLLSSNVEITTPINSFKSLLEAIYYLENKIEWYDGGLNHHPPILVTLLAFVHELPKAYRNFTFSLVYAIMDVLIAYNLVLLNRWYYKHNSARYGKNLVGYSDHIIALFYIFNPLIVLTNLSRSTITFTYLAITFALRQAVINKNVFRSMIALSVAAYLSYTPIFLSIPVLALSYVASSTRDWQSTFIQGSCIFISSCCLLVILSCATTASFEFIEQCYGTIIMFSKISPNVGLWWYFFTEMFEFFTPFYLGVFNLFSVIFIVPFTLRLFEYKNPAKKPIGDSLLAFWLAYLWLSLTKSYPCVGDLGFGLAILPIFRSTIIPHCKYLAVAALVLIVCLLLSPTFYYCWIVLGNGNSNFFYSINLFWGAIYGILLMDFTWACLTKDYIFENDIPEDKISSLRLSQL